jgi:sulfatase modifying factor 1
VDKIVEAILKIVPIDEWLAQHAGLSKEASAGLAFLILLGVFSALFSYGKRFFQAQKLLQKSKDLKPQWDYQAVQKAHEYYIPTQYQNASPARQEEPGFTHQYVARNKLIPFFIEKAFNEKADSERFYLILADSGMGKTTFMINLYLQYHSVFNRRRKSNMRLLKFSDPGTLQEIMELNKKGLEAVKNTILLLDALDEDPNIVSKDPKIPDEQAFRIRLDQIIDATRNFCEVVITCRTQYFPGQENDPYELKIKRADEQGFYTLNKLYVSPFTDQEVKHYLRKKFGWLPFQHRAKKQRAAQVIQQSKQLVMRPMMLSYIDYLVEDSRKYDTVFDIYETLVEKWLLREGGKRRNSQERQAFIQNLNHLSQQTAVAIYGRWLADKRLYLTKEEAVAIATQNQIDLKPEEVTGQSLLTCDGAGNWKFAHKSILEFFLAKALLEGHIPSRDFAFGGMDMTKQFFLEKNTVPLLLFVRGGTFEMGSPEAEPERQAVETQHPVQVSDFYLSACPITLGQFEAFIQDSHYQTDADTGGGSNIWNGEKVEFKAGVNWRCDVKGAPQTDKRHPVIHVSWNDASAYCAWLGKQCKAPVRLPTEAEWEYACRAGTTTPFHTGHNLTTKEANYNGNHPYNKNPKGGFLNKTSIVGSYPPNAWGFYDMHGNVWEWCQDWYDEKYFEQCKSAGTALNPTGPVEGSYRVGRGGSWSNHARGCRVADRDYDSPEYRYGNIGFRLASSPQSVGSPDPAFL